jgi:uncharacterized protein YlzI (FlbEa/FlbD family)
MCMRILTLTTVDSQPVTIIAEQICAIIEDRDQMGTNVTLSNGDSYTVTETMLEVVTMLQSVDKI